MHLRTTQILLLAFASLFGITSAGPLPQGDLPHEDASGYVTPEYNPPCLNATELEDATGGIEPGVVGIPCADGF